MERTIQMKGMNYYDGLITYLTGDTEFCEFNFINILSTDFVCIRNADLTFKYIRLDQVYSFDIKEGLDCEEIEED